MRPQKRAPARTAEVSKPRASDFPDRETIVAFIRAHPDRAGTREIAHEFGLKNADRAELKQILGARCLSYTSPSAGSEMEQVS